MNIDSWQAASYLHFQLVARSNPPEAAIILGSGLKSLSDRLTDTVSTSFAYFLAQLDTRPIAHSGNLILGTWAGRRILVFCGRLHQYEGHALPTVVKPVHIAASFGVRALILTNAAGGIHDSLSLGSLMVVRDHIEWNRPYCWRDPGLGGLGPKRPSPYAPQLLKLVWEAGRSLGLDIHEGIYAAVTGPNYETPAEIRALRAWGADAVGMSTTREAQAAFDLGLPCVALSCITNRAAGLAPGPITHDHVLSAAASAGNRLADLLERFLFLM